jgi:hypothetical protein
LSPQAQPSEPTVDCWSAPDRLEDALRHNGQSKVANSHRFPLVGFDDIHVATGPGYLVKGLIPRVGLTVSRCVSRLGGIFGVTVSIRA